MASTYNFVQLQVHLCSLNLFKCYHVRRREQETRTRLFSPLLPFLRSKFSLPLSVCHSSPFDLSLISVCFAEKTEFGLIALKTKRRSFCWNENKQHLKFKQSLEGTSSSEGDMSLLYSPSLNFTDAEFRKNQEFLDLSHHNHHYHQLEHQHNSSLMRYRSAPSSLFDGLINGTSGHDSAGDGGADNIGCEDYQYRSSSPEIDAVFARFMAPSNGSGDSRAHHGLQEFADRPVVKQEEPDSHMNFQTLPAHNLTSENNSASIENSAQSTYCNGMNSMALENSMQASQMDTGNGSNLVRQNSSPAGLFSKLAVNNGFAAMRNMASFRTSSGRSGEGSPSASSLGNQASFTSGQRLLPQISGIGDGGGSNSPDGNCRKRQYMSSFGNDSWGDGSLNGLKKLRDSDSSSMFSGLTTLNNQVVNSGNGRVTGSGLTHHLSLPKAAPEMATIEKFLQFQGTIPCKIRAKRGCATHPRSIAERVRRTRISERMRKLQELFPHIDKQTNTADMLDVAVEYIKDLQKQVKTLTDSRAKCTCSSKQKHHANQCA